MSIKNLPINIKHSILEKISENNDPAALKVALGNKNLKQVLEPGKINFRIKRNRNHRRVSITRPMSPPHYEKDRPLLQGSMSGPMRKLLKKIIDGKKVKKKRKKGYSYIPRPESLYKIEIYKLFNDKTGYTYNYDEMERIARQYVKEENRRFLNRLRAVKKWKAIQKMRKKIRNNDRKHKSLLSSVLGGKKISYY